MIALVGGVHQGEAGQQGEPDAHARELADVQGKQVSLAEAMHAVLNVRVALAQSESKAFAWAKSYAVAAAELVECKSELAACKSELAKLRETHDARVLP